MAETPSGGTILERMFAREGRSLSEVPVRSGFGKLLRKDGVRQSRSISRILDLPRRAWTPEQTRAAIDALSDAYRTPQGEQRLLPLQAISLCELHDFGGLVGAIAVGGGKTLITLLAAVALEARRGLLLVPANLRDKTIAEWPDIARHWRIPAVFRAESVTKHPGDGALALLSYEQLSRENYAEILDRLAPDYIGSDECHALKNQKAACTKRARRYFTSCEAKARPRVAFLSGTIMSRSIHDFAHLCEWALPDLNPTPVPFTERNEWAAVVDAEVAVEMRLAPGALSQLWNEEEATLARHDDVAATRSGFRRRLVDTPGVVASSENDLGVSLSIETVDPWGEIKDVDAAFADLRNTWALPDGEEIPDPPSFWRHAVELSLGFWYRWKYPPPEAWLDARRNWHRFVRETLKHNRRGLDSEKQVASACLRGEYDPATYEAWRAVRDSFKPETEAVWVSDHVIKFCAEWAQRTRGLVWVDHVQFGEALARYSGIPYYGAGGENEEGVSVIEAKPGEPAILSVASNSKGRNMQAWRSNLITSMKPRGTIAEQLLGRTHRTGQRADSVEAYYLAGCVEALEGFWRLREDAKTIEQTTGNRQKLCVADILDHVKDAYRSGPRWA